MPFAVPNQYSTGVIVTSAGEADVFGFTSRHLRLVNDGGVPVRFSFESTSPASTGDHELKAGEEWVAQSIRAGAFGLITTSTTTSTSPTDQRPLVRVLALG